MAEAILTQARTGRADCPASVPPRTTDATTAPMRHTISPRPVTRASEHVLASGFEKHLQTALAGILERPEPNGSPTSLKITRSIPLNYKMDRAFDYLTSYRTQLDFSSNELSHPNSYHLIFACNDDMALGAAQALGALSEGAGGNPAIAGSVPWRTRVIGYDGTSRMKTVLKLGHSPVSHTVCVNLKAQASRAVSVMSDLVAGKQPERFHKIPPQAWPPDHT